MSWRAAPEFGPRVGRAGRRAAEEPRPGRPGTTQPERTGALSRSPASLPVRDRTEALAASLRARQVSRMARSLVTGTFAAEIVDPGPDRLIERLDRDRCA